MRFRSNHSVIRVPTSRIVLALILLLLVVSSGIAPAYGWVLSEDEFEERSTEVGLLFRSFGFAFIGPTLAPPYSLSDANPSASGIFDLRLSFRHRTPNLKIVVESQLTNTIRSHGDPVGANLGTGVPALRWLPLQYSSDEPTLGFRVGLDWIYLAYSFKDITITVGRQPITLGRGKIWHPIDLVSSFSLTEVDTEYKPGSDAIRFDWAVAERSNLLLVAAVGELDDDHDAEVELRGSAFLCRFQQGLGDGEFALSLGYIRRDWVVALDGVYDLKHFDLAAEVTLTIPRDKSLTPNSDAPAVVEALLSATFKPHSRFTLITEVYYNGFGSFDREEYFALFSSERFSIGEMSSIGKLYAGVVGSWEAHALLTVNTMVLANLADPSGLLSISLNYSVSGNVDAILGGYIPIGRVPNLKTFIPRSEFGLYPYFVFAEVKVAL